MFRCFCHTAPSMHAYMQVDKSVVESIFEDGGNGSTQQSGTGESSSGQSPPSAQGPSAH